MKRLFQFSTFLLIYGAGCSYPYTESSLEGDEICSAEATARISTPAHESKVTGTVAVTVEVEAGQEIDKVDFRIGEESAGTDVIAPFGFSWDTSEVTPGEHEVIMIASFEQEEVTRCSISVEVEGSESEGLEPGGNENGGEPGGNETGGEPGGGEPGGGEPGGGEPGGGEPGGGVETRPEVDFVNPREDAVVAGTITLEVDITNNVAVEEVVFKLGTRVLGTDTEGPYSVLFDTTKEPQGIMTFEAEARTATNEVATASVKVDIDNGEGADTLAPTVSIVAPLQGEAVADVVTVRATASDNVGVTEVEFYLNGNSIGTDPTAPYQAEFDAAELPDGIATLVAEARDASGHEGTETITVEISD